jgi:hypothetical protein
MSKATTSHAAPTVGFNPVVEDILMVQTSAARKGRLTLWTIYDRPTDYPYGVIARRHEVPGGPTDHMLMGDIDFLREAFRDAGLHCLPRQENDDAKIVETWI